MYTLEKIITSLLCILYMLMPRIMPLLTPMLVHMWYEESISQVFWAPTELLKGLSNVMWVIGLDIDIRMTSILQL
jgi:hypothetical protein